MLMYQIVYKLETWPRKDGDDIALITLSSKNASKFYIEQYWTVS